MPENLEALARKIARVHGIDPDLFVRLIRQESGFDPRAVSPVGAQGLAQLMPSTARGLGVSDPFDPEQNLSGGARFLKSMLDRYGGDYRLALAAYNAGPGNVDKYGGVPPFAETQKYVATIAPTGGPKVMPSVQEAQVGDQDVFDQVVAAKGQWVGVKQIGTKSTKQPKYNPFGRKVGEEDVPTQNPTYRYTFKDGTYLDASKAEDGSYEVSGGTALTSLGREQKASEKAAAAPPKVVQGQIWDPEQQQFVPAPGLPGDAEKPIMVKGIPYRRVPNYPGDLQGHLEPMVPDAVAADKPEEFTLGRKRFRVDPKTGEAYVIASEPQDVPQRAPRYPEEEAQAQLNLEKTRLEIQKAQQGLTPGALLAAQNHLAVVDQIEKMMAADPKRMPPDLAARLIASSQANMEAAFRGTTVFDEQKQAADDARARQRIGADLLNTRLQAGSSLASSLTTSAFGSGVMMPAGKSSLGYAPAALAMSLTNDLQGGPEVSDFGRSLLMGAGVGPAPMPAPTGPVGPVVGTTASGVPVYDPSAGSGAGSGYLPPPRPSMPR